MPTYLLGYYVRTLRVFERLDRYIRVAGRFVVLSDLYYVIGRV